LNVRVLGGFTAAGRELLADDEGLQMRPAMPETLYADIEQEIYEAAVVPDLWPEVIRRPAAARSGATDDPGPEKARR
jgi:hypothetical protein